MREWYRNLRSRATDKDDAPRERAAKTRGRDKVSGLTAFWLKGLAGVAFVTLLAFAAAVYLWVENEEANRLRQLQGLSSIIARDLGNRVASLQERLHEWGADPQLRAAILAPDSEERRAEEESLAHLIPDALRVRFLNTGVAVAENQSNALSYAGLDLIHQAEEQRRMTQLEIHLLGRPEEHLAIAAPVLDDKGEAVVGVIHVSLSTSLLPSAAGAGGQWGFIGFQQVVADEIVTLDAGDGTPPRGLPDYSEPIPGTRLRVASWLDGDGVIDALLLLSVGASYVVLMGLVALATWLPLQSLRRALSWDYGGMIGLVEDRLNNRPMRRLQCKLAETDPVIGVLTGLLSRLQPIDQTEDEVEEEMPLVVPVQTDVTSVSTADKHSRPAERVKEQAASKARKAAGPILPAASVPAEIFRAYDIRGVVDRDLTADLVRAIGLVVGTEAGEASDQTVIVGRDTRRSSKGLCESLVSGLRESGRNVLDLGLVPTPLVYFATRYQGETSGVMVTASHNPESYNGFKVVIGGDTLAGEGITGLRERILAGSYSAGDGTYRDGSLIADYVDYVEKDVAIARTLKVVVDCGNAAAAVVAPQLYRALGCDLVELNCDPEGGFPNGMVPDPTLAQCLDTLRQTVVSEGADLGLAFDADGDRLGVVDSSGKIIWPDRVLMLLAADVLARHPGSDVVFDVKSSHHLATEILRCGGRPVMWKSGHAPLKAKLRETGAMLAGGWSGHIVFQERWFGFDDALYAGARLLEVLALDPRSSAEAFAELPEAIGTPELFVRLAEGEAARIMEAVLEQSRQLTGFDLSADDGLRVDSEQGWGLVRASNTNPALVFRFEADEEAELAKLQELFRQIMGRAAPELQLPF